MKPEDGEKIYACRAKGIFRKEGKKPLVGDFVEFEITHEKDAEGNVTKILERQNSIRRPSVSNVDEVLLIFALHTPEPSWDLIDRFLLLMERQGLKVVLVFNKSDLARDREEEEYFDIYRYAGVIIHFISVHSGRGIDELRDLLKNKTTVAAGPSGVGKSSLINCLLGKEMLEVGDLSRKIERGRQTTRHVELLEIAPSSYIIDTPGFSLLDLPKIKREELENYFPEIIEHKNCYFSGCAHISEPDCGVREALKRGEIPFSRYSSYVSFYEELSNNRLN